MFQNVQEDPTNHCIISKLFDLITDDILLQTNCPTRTSKKVLPEATKAVVSNFPPFKENPIQNNQPEAVAQQQEEQSDSEISSSATIKWSSSMALHLL